MSAAQDRLEAVIRNGGGSMPMTKTVDVKNKKYAEETELKDVLEEMANTPDGLLFGNAAYKTLCKKFRATDPPMDNNATDVDQSTGYYNESEWSVAGATAKVRVTYRVPLYVNSGGYERRGKRLELIS